MLGDRAEMHAMGGTRGEYHTTAKKTKGGVGPREPQLH